MSYLTVAEFIARAPDYAPRDANGDYDTARIEAAIDDAAGIIGAYLPELLAPDGTPLTPPPHLAGALRSIALDLALFRVHDAATGGEEVLAGRNKAALRLLSELAGGIEPHQPEEIVAEIVEGSSTWIRGAEPEE